MIELAEITKCYGAVRALDRVDLKIHPGEVLALAGENGSGKSTLVKILAGVVRPDSGTMTLDGEPVTWHRPDDALRHGISLVGQELALMPDLPTYENACLPLLRRRAMKVVDRRSLIRRTAAVFERLGRPDIDPVLPVRSLDTTERSVVQLAQALVTDPRLLLLDEATSRLGSADVRFVFDVVRRLREQGVATVLITHRISEMTELADRASVLRDGVHVGDLSRDNLTERELVRLMVGRDITPEHRAARTHEDGPSLNVQDLVVAGTHHPVDLTVRAGETVGLAGLVGAGRTELLETIAGLRRPANGSVAANGSDVPPGIRAARRCGIGLVPEDRHAQGLVIDGSVHQNLTLSHWNWHRTVRHRRERSRSRELVTDFGVKVRDLAQPASALSGGNQQKVVMARVLADEPEVLLLDEPSRGVDVGAREEIYRLVAAQADRGMAVLVASSEIAELLAVCDRVLVMHERRIVGELEGEALTEENIGWLSAGGEETP